MLDDTRKTGTATTCTIGLIARQRSAIASTLARPNCPVCAGNCRLLLDTQMSSASISVRCPTPLRTSASTTHDPTPPMPTTATRLPARRARVPAP